MAPPPAAAQSAKPSPSSPPPRVVRLSHILLLLSASILVLCVAYVCRNLQIGVSKVASYKDEGCVLLSNSEGPFGSEDIVHIGDGLFLVGAGDLGIQLFPNSVGSPNPGTMWLVDLQSPVAASLSQQMVLLNVSNLPSNIAFQPHGMYYSVATERLYVVSHGFLRGGERVFVLKVKRSEKAANRLKSVTLTFERALHFPADYGHGILNDVVEGANFGEIYITQWLPRSLPSHGVGRGESLTDTWNAIVNKLAPFTSLTRIHRCVFSESSKDRDSLTCTVASSGYSMVNGITAHPGRHVYWANDMTKVYELERNSDGSLSVVQTLTTPHYLDNIEWDDETNRLLIGTITHIIPALKKLEGDREVLVPGGIMAVNVSAFHMTDAYDVIIHNGKKLNMISAGGIWKGHAIMGSPCSAGVLRCPLS